MDDAPTLNVGLPEPLERRARMGPFASGADALKFALWAAVGALVASATVPLVWLPFLVGGFWVSAHRVDGRTPDERLLAYARWRLRPRSRTRSSASGSSARPSARAGRRVGGGLLRLPSGRWVALLRAAGVPLAYLPRADAERLFDRFRALLRATEEGICFRAGVEPFPVRPFLPLPLEAASDAEGDARSGYDDLVRRLARGRFRRRVWVAIPSPVRDAREAASATRAAAGVWLESLRAMGVRCEAVSGAALEAARHALGWGRIASGPGDGP